MKFKFTILVCILLVCNIATTRAAKILLNTEAQSYRVFDTIYLLNNNKASVFYEEFKINIADYQHLQPDKNLDSAEILNTQELAYNNWATVELYNSGIGWELFQAGYQNNKILIQASEYSLKFTLFLIEMELGGCGEFYGIGEKLIFNEGIIVTKSEIKYTKSTLQLGQKMHKTYKIGQEGIKEFRLPSGKRIDFIDIKNGIIYELKPHNPRAMRKGKKQLEMYMKELQSLPQYKGINWTIILDTY